MQIVKYSIWECYFYPASGSALAKNRVAEPEPAFFWSSGAGAVNLPRLRTKLKNNFLNGRKYVKVSKKYAESAVCKK